MKLYQLFSTFLLLTCISQFCLAQETAQAHLIDELGKPCSEDLMARLDNYFIQLNNDPTAIGYIVFYGDKSIEETNLNFIKILTEIYPNRRFDKTRLSLLRGENRDSMKIQFWIAPAGTNPPEVEKGFVSEKYTSTKPFDKNWADFTRWSGKLEIYNDGFFDLGCDFSPNREAFAKILLSNPELTGYLIVYTKFGKGKTRANQISNFAVKDLVRNFKIPQNRLKTIYGGNREEPEIEFWIVPKNAKPPVPKPEVKSKVKKQCFTSNILLTI